MVATPIADQLTNNTIRAYYALDEAMMIAHREDRNEFANNTARNLLENPDLPLLIRSRACMILGCSQEPDFLDMAKEGVRIAELGFSRCSEPGETEQQLVDAAHQVLKEAQEAFDRMEEGKGEDGEEGEATEGDRKKSGGAGQAGKSSEKKQ